jgi:hypothetical protein
MFGLFVVFSFDCFSSVSFCFVNLVGLDVQGMQIFLVSRLFVLVVRFWFMLCCFLVVGDDFFYTIVFCCSGGLRYVRGCCPSSFTALV